MISAFTFFTYYYAYFTMLITFPMSSMHLLGSFARRSHGFCSYNTFRFSVRSIGTMSELQRKDMITRMIRVDHAGELAADRIYAGQLSFLSRTSVGDVIRRMWDEEREHLVIMERLLLQHKVEPTLLAPVWHVAGFLLGASTAFLGKESAMACTVAVEELIAEHYTNQIRELLEDDPEKHKELLEIISKMRDEEINHHDKGLEHDAKKSPLFDLQKCVIQTGCKAAIWISERV